MTPSFINKQNVCVCVGFVAPAYSLWEACVACASFRNMQCWNGLFQLMRHEEPTGALGQAANWARLYTVSEWRGSDQRHGSDTLMSLYVLFSRIMYAVKSLLTDINISTAYTSRHSWCSESCATVSLGYEHEQINITQSLPVGRSS